MMMMMMMLQKDDCIDNDVIEITFHCIMRQRFIDVVASSIFVRRLWDSAPDSAFGLAIKKSSNMNFTLAHSASNECKGCAKGVKDGNVYIFLIAVHY